MSDGIQCAYEGCEREVMPRAAYCPGHMKQRSQGRPMAPLRPQGRSPFEVLTEAALAYAETDASDPAAWKRARDRLRMAAERYLKDRQRRAG